MKGLSVDFAFAFLLLVDLVVAPAAAQPFTGMHPDALLRGMNARLRGSRRTVQRQQAGRLPLYMMQLYRTMMTEERAASVSQTRAEDNPSLQDSDSVISLVAKSEYSALEKYLSTQLFNSV